MNGSLKPQPKAYSYLRFSTPEQLKGDSFRRQTRMAEEYALKHGLELDDSLTFHDIGVSAFRGKNAEAGRLADFLDAVKSGAVPSGSLLLVEALDRLSRLAPRRALRVLEDIIEQDITVVTLNDGKAYTAEAIDKDPMDLMMAILLFMRANEESATKSRRLKAAWEGKREKATEKPLTSTCPAWLSLNKESGRFEVIEERVTIVRQMFEMTLDGIGYEKIAYTFNTLGLKPFGRASHWHRTYVKKVLSNPAVIGALVPHIVEHHAGHTKRVPLSLIQGYYPAVIDEETFQRVQSLSLTNSTPKVKGQAVINNLLSGLAKCPKCGATMTRVNKGSTSKAGKPYLVCARAKAGGGCTYHAVRQEVIENALISNLDLIFASAPSGNSSIDDEVMSTTAEQDALEDMIQNLLEAISMNPTRALTDKLRELESAKEAVSIKLVKLQERAFAAFSPLLAKRQVDLAAVLLDTPIDRPKANTILRQIFNAVVIDWASGSIDFEWKQGGESSIIYSWPTN